MNVALCVSFLEEDIWESCLLAAASPHRVEFTECNSPRTLLPLLELKIFSILVVVVNGVAGLEAVRDLRAKAPDVPLIWISDEDYSLFGYQYHVTCFLRRPVCHDELRKAVAGCLKLSEKGKENPEK